MHRGMLCAQPISPLSMVRFCSNLKYYFPIMKTTIHQKWRELHPNMKTIFQKEKTTLPQKWKRPHPKYEEDFSKKIEKTLPKKWGWSNPKILEHSEITRQILTEFYWKVCCSLSFASLCLKNINTELLWKIGVISLFEYWIISEGYLGANIGSSKSVSVCLCVSVSVCQCFLCVWVIVSECARVWY